MKNLPARWRQILYYIYLPRWQRVVYSWVGPGVEGIIAAAAGTNYPAGQLFLCGLATTFFATIPTGVLLRNFVGLPRANARLL